MPYKNAEDRRAAAQRRYAEKPSWRGQIIQKRDLARKRNRDYVIQVKTGAPCTDCGVPYPPYVMHFDHLGEEDKDRDVSVMAASPVSLARLKAEIAKCEIVCANCHATRTFRRRTLVAEAEI